MSSSPQIITCKAAVIWGVGEPLKVEEIQVEPPKSSEVRVKMLYASICHTDISKAKGFPIPLFPRVLGHEGVGIVESTGDKVNGLKVGDVVIPTTIGECGECENCKSSETNLCLNFPVNRNGLMSDNTSRMSIKGQKLYHLFTCSTWSEYMVVDHNYLFKIDPSVNLQHASLMSCGFSTGFGAAWKEAEVKEGATVAVLGLGTVGLGAVEGARIRGASMIIGIDKNGMKKEKGQVLGMTHFINSGDESDKPISELVKGLTGGIGVDYCFDCTGAEHVLNEAVKATKLGKGMAITVGSAFESVKLDLFPILGRTLKGSIFGGLKLKHDLPIVLEKCKNKDFHLDELLTHEVTLQEIDKAFGLLKQPDCVKVLIKIG